MTGKWQNIMRRTLSQSGTYIPFFMIMMLLKAEREDFTMIKAILQNVTFKQDFKNVEREIYLEIRSQLVSLINSINKITKQSLLSSEVFQMALYKTEDCFVKFILYIPWNKKSSEVGTIGGKYIFGFIQTNIS